MEINRRLLSRAGLSRNAMEAALDITGLRPDLGEWREFAVTAMRLAGILSLAAGVVFFVAYNWDEMRLYGRFAIVEIPLLAALVVAWIKGADQLSGKLALMLAVLLTGALLALFGQTYQTGADVYELFFGWALLALPWVLACRYASCWAIWILLVNLGLLLYLSAGHGWLVSLFGDRLLWSPFSLPFLFNLLLYVTVNLLSDWEEWGLSNGWLRRGLLLVAMTFGTFAMIYRISGGWTSSGRSSAGGAIEVLLFIAASAALAAYTYVKREDLFTFAVLALSWILVTTTQIGRAIFSDGALIGGLFFIAIWVIGASTAAVKGIAYLGRQWRVEEAAK